MTERRRRRPFLVGEASFRRKSPPSFRSTKGPHDRFGVLLEDPWQGLGRSPGPPCVPVPNSPAQYQGLHGRAAQPLGKTPASTLCYRIRRLWSQPATPRPTLPSKNAPGTGTAPAWARLYASTRKVPVSPSLKNIESCSGPPWLV